MNSSASSSEAGRMLADLSWTRALAATLVGSGGAEDVAQEAWLAALGRRGESWPPSRRWLAGTVRNLSARWWRTAKRREVREAIASREEGLPSTAALVARSEEQQRMARMTLALGEPYRTVVLLRFQEGLEPAAIARHQGVPVDTVRWRLRKGLNLLRAQLEGEEGSDWRLALLPFAKSSHPLDATGVALSTPITIGGLLLGTKFTIAFAASILALVTVLWVRDKPAPIATLKGAQLDQVSEISLLGEQDKADRSQAFSPSTSRVEEQLRTAVTAPEEPAPIDAYVFTGRALDEHDQPLLGLGVSFSFGPDLPRTTTDEFGRYSIALEEHHSELMVLAIGDDPFREQERISLQYDPTQEGYRAFHKGINDLGTLVLGPAGSVSGRVVHRDGSPVSEPRVMATGDAKGSDWGDGTGHFTIGHLEAGHYMVDAQQYGISVSGVAVDVKLRENTFVEITALPSPSIAGTIRSEDGLPLEGVRVGADSGYRWNWDTKSMADGSFRLNLAQERPFNLDVYLRGWDAVDLPQAPVRPGTEDVVIHMRQSPKLLVRVIDPATDEPLQSYELTVLPHRGSAGTPSRRDLHYGRIQDSVLVEASDGVTLINARPEIDAIKIHAPGRIDATRTVTYDPGAPGVMTFRPGSGQSLAGRVTWRGAAVENATVRLVRVTSLIIPDPLTSNGKSTSISPSERSKLTRHMVGGYSMILPVTALYAAPEDAVFRGYINKPLAKTLTTSDGSFSFEKIKGDRGLVLFVSPPEDLFESSRYTSAELRFNSARNLDLGAIALPEVARVTGRVNLLQRGQLEGHKLSIWSGEWIRGKTDEKGVFNLTGVPPGEHLMILEESPSDVGQRLYFAVQTRAGQTSDVELELNNRPFGEVDLTLLANGEPLARHRVSAPTFAEDEKGRGRFRGETDGRGLIQGRFSLGSPRLIRVEVQGVEIIVPHARLALAARHSSQTVNLQHGSLRLTRSAGGWPSTGHLELKLTSRSDPSAWANCRYDAHPTGLFDGNGQLASAEEGTVLIPFLPAGSASIEIGCHGESGLIWSEVRDITIEAGGLVDLDL